MSALERMHDLSIEALPDGGIRLEQSAGSLGEPAVIDLHPMQVRLIAERAGLLAPNPVPTWPRGFIRRMERLRDAASELYSLLASVPSFPPGGSPTDDVIAAERLLDAFDDLLADFGIASDGGDEIPQVADQQSDSAPESDKPINEPINEPACRTVSGSLF